MLRVLVAASDPGQRNRGIERATALISRVSDGVAQPHHLAQAVLLAHHAALPSVGLIEKLGEVHLRALGGNAYLRGQLLWAKSHAGLPFANRRDEADWLADWIQKTDPTKGNFQDFCAALVGLAATRTDEGQEQTQGRVDVLFSNGFQRATDGSWYHFAWETSWALLALSMTAATSRVKLSTPQLLRLLSDAEEAIDGLDDQVRRYKRDAGGPYLFVITASAAVIASSPTLFFAFSFGTGGFVNWLQSGAGWFLGPVLPAFRLLVVAAQDLRSGHTNSTWLRRFFGIESSQTPSRRG